MFFLAGVGITLIHNIYLDNNYFLSIDFCPAGIGITVAAVAAVIFLLLGLCCCWLARLVGRILHLWFSSALLQ